MTSTDRCHVTIDDPPLWDIIDTLSRTSRMHAHDDDVVAFKYGDGDTPSSSEIIDPTSIHTGKLA